MKYVSMFDKIDLHLIRVLYTVLTERSVSRAAQRLNLSQPAMSNARSNAVFMDQSLPSMRQPVLVST